MFDHIQRKDPVPLNKALVVCAVGAGIGFGTCGIGLLIGNERITPKMAGAGMILFFASILGFLVIGILALIRLIFDRLTK